MDYTQNDKEFIEKWLNRCLIINRHNTIYYITNDNILRRLKYNRLLKNKKDLIFNFNDINSKDIILEYDLDSIYFWINFKFIWQYFKSKYNYNFYDTNRYINNILCDIFNVDKDKYFTDYPNY